MDDSDLIGEPIDDVPKREPGENCNARRSRGGVFRGYCKRTSGWGTDSESGRCSSHGGSSSGAPEGNENAKTHGAFSEHFRSDLTEDEVEAIDDLVSHLEDITGPRAIAAESAAEALMKYKRSADSRFLREARQWFGDFNLIPNAEDVNLGGDGGGIVIDLQGDE